MNKNKSKEQLWSMSTSVREAERTIGFLQTAKEIENKNWDTTTQKQFQVLLVKNRYYLDDENNTQNFSKLNKRQCDILRDKTYNMSYADAENIIDTKNYVGGAEMRGRQSINPLRKLGLVNTSSGKVIITDIGNKLLNGKIDLSEFMLDSLLKYQLPNPHSPEYNKWNTKPFISALRLIKTVNELCFANGEKEKGVSKTEFGIFVLSLKRYDEVNNVAKIILKFRYDLEKLPQNQRDDFIVNFIQSYLAEFNNPIHNVQEYTDNVIRYLRITKYIFIRGKYDHAYIDLEPRRMAEINAILSNDNGSAKQCTMQEWEQYIGTYGTYNLPFENVLTLTKIVNDTLYEINTLAKNLNRNQKQLSITLPTNILELKKIIEYLRMQRTALQNIELKQEYHNNLSKIEDAKNALNDIIGRNKNKFNKKFSIELEKWANVALNILNDASSIKPNTIVGDDNEPIFTAPNGVADIECYYKNFNAICEVTMLTSRDQWYNEGQPVMRHLRDFENKNKNSYCLFVAPSLHIDTINTFWTATKYEYQGQRQKIIPLTITQLIELIDTVRIVKQQDKKFTSVMLEQFYKSVTEVNNISNSFAWIETIKNTIITWKQKCIA
jgi:hypothetical protein